MADSRRTAEILVRARDDTRRATTSVQAGFRTMADGTVGALGRVTRSFLNLRNVIAGGVAAMAAKKLFEPELETEKFRTQYENLLGDAESAKTRVDMLMQFSDVTPFEPEPVVRAALVLDRFTRGAEDTRDMVRLVGDAAAATGSEFSELGMWVGRGYSMIKGGAPIGEVTRRLLELGVITPDVQNKISDMQKQNKSATEVWGVLRGALEEHNGAMEKLSQTTGGRLSTLAGKWSGFRRDVAAEALPAVNVAIDDLIATIDNLRESGELQKWGEATRQTIEAVWERLKSMAAWIAENRTLLTTLGVGAGGLLAFAKLVQALTLVKSAIMAIKTAYAAVVAARSADTASTAANTAVTGANTAAKTANVAALNAQAAAAISAKAAFSTLGGALGSLGAIAGTAFVGWKLGTLLGEVSGLNREMGRLVENAALKKQQTELEMFQQAWAKRFEDRGGLSARDDRGRTMSEAWREMEKRRSERAAGARETEQQAAETDPQAAAALAAAEEAATAEQEAREKVAGAVQKAAENEIERRKSVAAQIEKTKQDIAEARERADEDRQRRELQGIADGAQERIREAEEAARAEDVRAERIEREVAEQHERLLLPRADRRVAEREDADQAKREKDLERQIARARKRQEEGGRLTARGKELVAFDERRREAAAAREHAQAQRDRAEGEQARLAEAQARLADLAAVQIDTEKDLTAALRDLENELREGGRAEIGGQAVGDMTEADLAAVAELARTIADATQAARDRRAAEADILARAGKEGEPAPAAEQPPAAQAPAAQAPAAQAPAAQAPAVAQGPAPAAEQPPAAQGPAQLPDRIVARAGKSLDLDIAGRATARPAGGVAIPAMTVPPVPRLREEAAGPAAVEVDLPGGEMLAELRSIRTSLGKIGLG